MPPDAARETLYAVPTVAFGREAVVIVKVVLAGGVEVGVGEVGVVELGVIGVVAGAAAMYVSTLHPVMPSFQLQPATSCIRRRL